ncbi:MAG TPA: CRISPR-associated endonuclease Cas1 [Candidatus Acidoferrales bacterium]|nr:CRISPR-associated endonuclease Cas1 [Candidatus Acidoferrales bacterium]
MTDETYWPARTVGEYAYCPRLFYYMEVEGVFLPSVDTEKGQAVHRRVNRPSAEVQGNSQESEPENNGRPKTVRSLVLTSEKLGLTATLDLAEVSGSNAIPVEYRKGAPKRNPIARVHNEFDEDEERDSLSVPEPWPTDRVQVGLQALLLEEAGYEVREAVLYYAAEKLRLTIPVDSTLKSEALATLEAARTCASGTRPLPLINDPRCVRCSLQPICLPDEVNCERSESNGEHLSPRKIWPPRDEGIQIVAQRNGTRIGIKGMALTISDASGKARKKEIPLASVDSLSLLGSVQISTQAMKVLADHGIPIALLSAAGRLVGMMDPLDSVSAVVRRKQVLGFESPEKCLELARALITAKIANQRKLLVRNHSDLPADISEALAVQVSQAAKADSLESLRGHEGQAAAVYFDHFAGMLKGAAGAEFDVNGRKRRPPPDPVNSCLSMAYSMLTHECVAALRVARLEPSIGAFHVSRPGRPALALDLMEPFRPLIADSIAIAAFNRGELAKGHFQRTSAGCTFTDAGRKAFFEAYARRMDTEVTHPAFGYKLSYRRMLALHARMIAAWCVGEVETLAFLTTR